MTTTMQFLSLTIVLTVIRHIAAVVVFVRGSVENINTSSNKPSLSSPDSSSVLYPQDRASNKPVGLSSNPKAINGFQDMPPLDSPNGSMDSKGGRSGGVLLGSPPRGGPEDARAVTSRRWCTMTLPKGCTCLKHDGAFSINCSSLRLTAVPRQIGPLQAVVKTLNLERNRIKEIGDGDLFGLKIERLLLAVNSLEVLRFLSFWGLEYSLETLDLSYNQFRRIPSEGLRLLRNLKSLFLTGNRVAILNDFDFGYMRKLEVLTLDKNPLMEVSSRSFAGASLVILGLDTVCLTQQQLVNFPMKDLKHLKGLSLADNNISAVPPQWFYNLKSLRYLNIGYNKITSIAPGALTGLEANLRILEINNNGLIQIPSEALAGLVNLETLDLSHNKIKRVTRRAFNFSSNLHTVYLNNNRLRKMSQRSFTGSDNIQHVDLRDNRLITLDDRMFASFAHNSSVFLSGNPWLCNCIIRWIYDERKRRTRIGSVFADDLICDRPESLHGRQLMNLASDELTCNHDYYYYYSDNEEDGEGEDDAENDGYSDEDVIGGEEVRTEEKEEVLVSTAD